MHRYNEPEVVTLLHAVIADKGADYVYEESDCVYFDADGNPMCIVGHLLARIGITEAPPEVCDLSVWYPKDPQGWRQRWWQDRFTDNALILLGEVQVRQDIRVPWGEALTQALDTMTVARRAGEI